MEMLVTLLADFGLLIVFANVLAEQLGVPVPAYPTMMVAGALAATAGEPVWPIVAVAVLAALIADLAWYGIGTRYGASVLRTLCRISLSPDSCVAMTRARYQRYGAPSLMFAKFITGFATVATALAGEARTRLSRFVFYDTIGATLWAALAVGLGVLFKDAVQDVIATLADYGQAGLALVVLALAAFLAWKAWQRHRFRREIEMPRATVADLRDLLDTGRRVAILDVRSESERERDGWIPGSQAARLDTAPRVDDVDEVVVYCACPNEASAAMLALKLKSGRHPVVVRPLEGGLAAWIAAGGTLQRSR